MFNRLTPVFIVLFAFPWSIAAISGQEHSTLSFQPDEYTQTVRPLLDKYCVSCHAPGDMEGLDFLTPQTANEVKRHRQLFADVVEQLESNAMPPKNLDQPSEVERKRMIFWLKKTLDLKPSDTQRVAKYVVASFQDSQGDLWFGTISRGVARFDGERLTYFDLNDGLPSLAVPSFAEDRDGNLWVGTQDGVCRFDGQRFVRLGPEVGLPPRTQSSPQADAQVFATRAGELWICQGTKTYRMVNGRPVLFQLPKTKSKADSFAILSGSKSILLEDRHGNLWFAVDGYGVFRYDGRSFRHFTKSNGLCSNNVTAMAEDQKGNLWFTCMQSFQPEMTGDGGLCRFDGKSFTKISGIQGLENNDLYSILATSSGDIWVGATGVGAYRYDGKTFKRFSQTDQPHRTRNFGLQSIMEDRDGTLWFGFSGGLFRFDGSKFYNITPQGPWKSLPAALAELLTDPSAQIDWIRAEVRQAVASLREGQFDSALAKLVEIKRRWPEEVSVKEDVLNRLGYELWSNKQMELASQVFELNTKLYPAAFNTFDSLGEIYLHFGDEERSLKNYRRSIELNPENGNAKSAIRKIKAAQRFRDLLIAPEGWTEEVIECPPRFAPTMTINGLEHLRLPPGFRDPNSDWFVSYLFAIEFAKPAPMDQREIGRQLLTYFRGLAEGGVDADGKAIDTSKFEINAIATETPTANEYHYEMTWQEPFVEGRQLQQILKIKVLTQTKPNSGEMSQVLFVCGSPQPATSDVWRQLLKIRARFEEQWQKNQ